MNREEQAWAVLVTAAAAMAAKSIIRGEEALWPVALVAITALEYEAIKQGDLERTITRTTRRWFRTHHPAGRTAFLVTWTAFAAWYAQHILKGPRVESR